MVWFNLGHAANYVIRFAFFFFFFFGCGFEEGKDSDDARIK